MHSKIRTVDKEEIATTNVDMHNGRQGINMTVLHVRDTLAEFITAANLLLEGASDAKVIAMDEPAEHFVQLQCLSAINLAIQIRWFKDWASWKRNLKWFSNAMPLS